MGMDGLSFSNTGAVKEQTSAEFANKTQQVIQSDTTNDYKQVQSTSVNQRVKPKDEEEENDQKKQKQKQEEEFEDGLVETPETDDESDTEDEELENLQNPNKDFYVKLNVKDDIIELYDSATNRLIETISGNELGELVQKLNMASGIFVNKKV